MAARFARIRPQLVNMSLSVLTLVLGGQIVWYSQKKKSLEKELEELKNSPSGKGNRNMLVDQLRSGLVGPNASWMAPALARLKVDQSALNQNLLAGIVEDTIDQILKTNAQSSSGVSADKEETFKLEIPLEDLETERSSKKLKMI